MIELDHTRRPLFHFTHEKNAESILKNGLLVSFAQNKKAPYVWLAPQYDDFFFFHVSHKHEGWLERNLVVFEVWVRPSDLILHPLLGPRCGYVYKTGDVKNVGLFGGVR